LASAVVQGFSTPSQSSVSPLQPWTASTSIRHAAKVATTPEFLCIRIWFLLRFGLFSLSKDKG
jgi:hypothetical protein